MKDVLVINGSPRGEKSNTFKITQAFCEGLNSKSGYSIQYWTVSEMNIKHCSGCFSCWTKTPGRCIFPDDMQTFLENYIHADIVIWSFPLYYFGMPSKIKALMDRTLPALEPFIENQGEDLPAHTMRYDLSNQENILISTCGFFTIKNNYEALEKQFDIFQGHHYKKKLPIRILCPEGALFSVTQLSSRVNNYLEHVKTAGKEFAIDGQFSEKTQQVLDTPLFPPEPFMEMANASWDIKTGDSPGKPKNNEAKRFMQQMTAVYNPAAYKKDLVVEFAYTDINQTFQLHIQKDQCQLSDSAGTPFDTRIETPYSTWMEISEGRMNGPRAMMDGLYKVTGDFDVMNYLDELFGTGNHVEKIMSDRSTDKRKAPSLSLLLLPWITLWIFLPMPLLAVWGGIAAIGLSSLIPILGVVFKLTPYDRLTVLGATVIGDFWR